MATVSDILDAIRTLPRPERMRLAQELNKEFGANSVVEPAPSSDAEATAFRTWLSDLLTRLPESPQLPAHAFDRGSIYDE